MSVEREDPTVFLGVKPWNVSRSEVPKPSCSATLVSVGGVADALNGLVDCVVEVDFACADADELLALPKEVLAPVEGWFDFSDVADRVVSADVEIRWTPAGFIVGDPLVAPFFPAVVPKLDAEVWRGEPQVDALPVAPEFAVDGFVAVVVSEGADCCAPAKPDMQIMPTQETKVRASRACNI